jgi:hypothetical protein
MASAIPIEELEAPDRPAAGARKSAIIARKIINNWRCKFRLALGEMNSSARPADARKPVAESIDYIDRVYRDYVFYGHLSQEHIEGRSILEIGPADDFGVALEFLTAGAARVVTLDKFTTNRDTEHAGAVYRSLRERLSGAGVRHFDSAVDLGNGEVRFNPERLQSIEGVATEDSHRVLAAHSFSLIVSRAVLSEIHQIDRAFTAMDRLLEPGGRMLHKIDLTDYGMFSNHGRHPLEFLTIPETLYTAMTEYSNQPNRRRIDYYRNKMRELGYHGGLLVTSIVGEPGEVLPHKASIEPAADYGERSLELVSAIRPRLARPFRNLRDTDLLATGIFLIARKPA